MKDNTTGSREGKQRHTPGPWSISPNGTYIRANGVHGWNIAEIIDQPPYTKANVELIASAPQLKAENESLKLEVEMLKRNKETAMLLALEFGFKQCEKGENLDGAFINYNKLIQP